MLPPAPLNNSFDQPKGAGSAFWAVTKDCLRLRICHWQGQGRGTVFLFPGRTEYIEKYNAAALEITKMGFDCIAIDWRGQGLSDRLIQDRRLGHIADFHDYQNDVETLLEMADHLNLPRPFHLLAHSMGGCIGLRRLLGAHPFEKAVFSGPMWGIKLPLDKNILAHAVLLPLSKTPFHVRIVPTLDAGAYPNTEDFMGNLLTHDPEIYGAMRQQLSDNPDLAVGGPTIGWMGAAIREMRALMRAPAPNIPALTFLGSDEEIVTPARIHQKMRDWPNGVLRLCKGVRHEIMMERAPARDAFYKGVDDFLP